LLLLHLDLPPPLFHFVALQGRYIISCHSLEERTQLLGMLSGALGSATAPYELTQTMPLVVANMSRAELRWLCQDPQASACVNYIERDEQVTLASAR